VGSTISSVPQPLAELVDPFRGDVRDKLSVQASSLRATPFCCVPMPLGRALSGLKLVLELLELFLEFRVVHLFLEVAYVRPW